MISRLQEKALYPEATSWIFVPTSSTSSVMSPLILSLWATSRKSSRWSSRTETSPL